MQFIGALAGLSGVDFGVDLARQFLVLKLVGTMIPVGDFLRQPVLHGGHGPGHQILAALANLIEVDRNKVGNRMADYNRFPVTSEPCLRLQRGI